MRALYCLANKKFVINLSYFERAWCGIFGIGCSNCSQCVFKEIEEDRDE